MLLVPLIIFVMGAGIFLYPAVSNLLAEKNQKNVIRTYRRTAESIDAATADKLWEEAKIYNENLAGDPVHDPFIIGSGYVLPDNYEDVLNLNGDGVMGYVEIPKIDVYLPIYHGTSEEALEKGAGHLDVTALPVGGEGYHSVISAHRGLPSSLLFTRLDEMEIGDVFYIHILDETLAYQVDQINVILPEELTLLQPEEGKDLVTLLTCTPYSVNTHRLLVRGSRIPYTEEEEVQGDFVRVVDTGWRRVYQLAVAAGVGTAGACAVVFFSVRKRKNSKRSVRKKRRR